MDQERRHHEKRRRSLARVRRLAVWLDDAVHMPVLGTRVGLDAIVGLLPGIGDFAGLALSGVAVLEAVRLRAPKAVIGRMLGNLAVDFVIGLVPVAGDLFDVYWKANRRNLRLLEDWLAAELEPRQAERRRWPTALFLIAALALALAVSLWLWRMLAQLI